MGLFILVVVCNYIVLLYMLSKNFDITSGFMEGNML